MKSIILLFFFGIFSFLSNYSFSQTGCFDSLLIDQSIICPTVIDPVCGCDGITYNNACEATYYYGITSYTPGPCNNTTCQTFFTYTMGQSPCEYIFTAQGADSFSWDFGDGSTASGQTVSHTFAADGAYFIGLLGYNANGVLCDSTGQYLTIVGCGGNTPCQAGFQFSTDSSCTYTFYGYGANSYEWWYDDMVLIGEIVTLYISPNSIETLCMYAYDNQGFVCDTVCEDIICDISGLSELDNHLDVSVYPNPTSNSGTVSIKTDKTDEILVQLIDPLGKIVQTIYEGQLISGSHELSWNNNNLVSGLYMIQVNGHFGSINKKLLIQR